MNEESITKTQNSEFKDELYTEAQAIIDAEYSDIFNFRNNIKPIINEEYSDDENDLSSSSSAKLTEDGNLSDYEEEEEEFAVPRTNLYSTEVPVIIDTTTSAQNEKSSLKKVYCSRCKCAYDSMFGESHQGDKIAATICKHKHRVGEWFARGRGYEDLKEFIAIPTGYGSCYDGNTYAFVKTKLNQQTEELKNNKLPIFLTLSEVAEKYKTWLKPELVLRSETENTIEGNEYVDICDNCISDLLKLGEIRHYNGSELYPIDLSICDCCCELMSNKKLNPDDDINMTNKNRKINFVVLMTQNISKIDNSLIITDTSRDFESNNITYIVKYGLPYPNWFFVNARICNACVKEHVKKGILILEKRLSLLFEKPVPRSVEAVKNTIEFLQTSIRDQIHELEISDGKREDTLARWRDNDYQRPPRTLYLKRKKTVKKYLKRYRKHLELVIAMNNCHMEIRKRLNINQ